MFAMIVLNKHVNDAICCLSGIVLQLKKYPPVTVLICEYRPVPNNQIRVSF